MVGPVLLLGGRVHLGVVDAAVQVENVDVDSGAAANCDPKVCSKKCRNDMMFSTLTLDFQA